MGSRRLRKNYLSGKVPLPTLKKQDGRKVAPIDIEIVIRDDLKIGMVWWVPHCGTTDPRFPAIGHVFEVQCYGEHLGMRVDPPRAPFKVSLDDAKEGKGHSCPVCGIVWGCYVGIGMPRPQGQSIWGEKIEDGTWSGGTTGQQGGSGSCAAGDDGS